MFEVKRHVSYDAQGYWKSERLEICYNIAEWIRINQASVQPEIPVVKFVKVLRMDRHWCQLALRRGRRLTSTGMTAKVSLKMRGEGQFRVVACSLSRLRHSCLEVLVPKRRNGCNVVQKQRPDVCSTYLQSSGRELRLGLSSSGISIGSLGYRSCI